VTKTKKLVAGEEPLPVPIEVKREADYSAEVQQALSELPTRKAKFILNVAAGMTPIEALLAAGWQASHTVAKTTANKILRDDEPAKNALTLIKLELAKKAEYGFEKFMAEMNDAIRFAKSTNNATALVRAIELKGKASGHIVDRVDTRSVSTGFSIQIAGVEPPKVIDG
jgi:hypothetical protein